MLEGVGMLETAGKTLTEDQVLLIAKALGDRRRYEILKRLGERPDALANDNAVIHLMVARLASGSASSRMRSTASPARAIALAPDGRAFASRP
jgi:DNA-binding transcriptional ArsR family regulator